MQTCDPLKARQWFKLRTVVNWAIVLPIFILLVFILQNLMSALLADVIAIGIAFCVFFFVLDKRGIGIKCTSCQQHIETNTSWVCGFCQQKVVKTDDFPFINRCEHDDCKQEPKAYQCHHCRELIFFTHDKLKINFATCANLPSIAKPARPAKKDKKAEKISEQEDAIRETEYKLRKAKLELELKAINESLEPLKEKTQQEILEESAKNFRDRNMSGAAIVARMKAENAERHKNNPIELEKANLLVDQWALNHLDEI